MTTTQKHSPKSVNSTGSSPRIALIGCGAIAESYYLPALAKQTRVLEALTLVDRNIDRARELAAVFNIKTCVTDYRETIDKIDGAIIALPTHLHHPASMEFLSRGIPVLCEKPLAESAGRGKEMVDAAIQSGSILCVNYLQRLIPTFAKVKEWLEDDSFGQLLSIEYVVGEEFDWPSVSGFYFNSPISARGVLRDRGAHAIDHICWWLGGKPSLVVSQNDSFGGSEAVAYLKFKYRECIGEMKLSWLATFPSRFKVVREAGTLEGDVYDYRDIFLETVRDRRKRLHIKTKLKTKLDVANKVVENFLGVVTNKEEPLISGENVLDSLRLTDECYASVARFPSPWYEAIR